MGEQSAEPSQRRGRPSAHDTGGAVVPDDLSQLLADLARDMQRQGDAAAVMEVIVATAVAMVPGAEEASISLTQGRRRVVSAMARSVSGSGGTGMSCPPPPP